MAESQTGTFEYDAIVLHTEDETDKADNLCCLIEEHGEKTERPLKIVTFDQFAHPGKTHLQNLDDAVEQAKFILCSEHLSTSNEWGEFSAHVALQSKVSQKFILLRDGKGNTNGNNPAMESLPGSKLTPDWDFHSKRDKEKMIKMLSGGKVGTAVKVRNLRRQGKQKADGKDNADLPDEVVEDATPDNDAKPAPPDPEALRTRSKQQPAKNKVCSLTAVILHSEDERDDAENFCRTLREYCQGTGRSIEITTKESMAHPGKQETENLNDVIQQAKVVISSESFYKSGHFERFSADAAAYNKKREHNFFLLYVGRKCTSSASMSSLKGMEMLPNWQFRSEDHKKKLARYLCGDSPSENAATYPEVGNPAIYRSRGEERENRGENSAGNPPGSEAPNRQLQNVSTLPAGERTDNSDYLSLDNRSTASSLDSGSLDRWDTAEGHIDVANRSTTSVDFSFSSLVPNAQTEGDDAGSDSLLSRSADQAGQHDALSAANVPDGLSQLSLDDIGCTRPPSQSTNQVGLAPLQPESNFASMAGNGQHWGISEVGKSRHEERQNTSDSLFSLDSFHTEEQFSNAPAGEDDVATTAASTGNSSNYRILTEDRTPRTSTNVDSSMSILPCNSMAEDGTSIVAGADSSGSGSIDLDQTLLKEVNNDQREHTPPFSARAGSQDNSSDSLASMESQPRGAAAFPLESQPTGSANGHPQRLPPDGASAPQNSLLVEPRRSYCQLLPSAEFLEELSEADREEVREHLL